VSPSKEERLAFVPSSRSSLIPDQFVIRHEVAKGRLALGVRNHFNRVVDAWAPDDPIVTDAGSQECRDREVEHPPDRTLGLGEDPCRPRPPIVLDHPSAHNSIGENQYEPFEQVAEPDAEPDRLAGQMEPAEYEPAAFQIDRLGT
jgi:hypothetical protein